jgi:REP element-mobilizing transposase RayT/AraC-like DNA-binding protein
MARPLRICFPGAVYHVITRGNAKEAIVRDDIDGAAFLRTLARVVERFGWLCHSYCLMDNHYHLVIETPQPNLSNGMRQLNGLHAQFFNARYNRCGLVFQSRFRSLLVQKDSYLLAVSRYVVLNPVRAGVCDRPEQWPWSSYRATAGLVAAPTYLTIDWLLAQFAPTRRLAQRRYRAHVHTGIADALEQRVRGERLGADDFLRDTHGYDPPLAEIPRRQVEPLPPRLDEIFAGNWPTPIARAYRRHGYTLRQIAEHLGCSYSTVSRRLRREENRLHLGSAAG